MFSELRRQRPPVYKADERERWFAAIGQTITALPTYHQRFQAIEDVANDLYAAQPGMPLSACKLRVINAVLEQPLPSEERSEANAAYRTREERHER
jgi:hypothetical protein